MIGHTFFGKQRLCYTDVCDFTDYQGIGHDPLYKRYESVFSVIKRTINPDYQHFLATPEYNGDEDQIRWYIDNWSEPPVKLSSLKGDLFEKYNNIKNETIGHYKQTLQELNGEDLQIMSSAIKYVNDDHIYCCDNKVFLVAWGMTPETNKHQMKGSIIHEYDFVKKWTITFDAGEHGKLSSKLDRLVTRVDGSTLTERDIPEIIPDDDYTFEGWKPYPIGYTVTDNITFKAEYKANEKPVSETAPPILPIPADVPLDEPCEEKYFTCKFDAGNRGHVNGSAYLKKKAGTVVQRNEIPSITPQKGFRFIGWDINPNGFVVNDNHVFHARYEEKVPWWRRWWLWLTGLFAWRGCLRWLLWLLLFALALWLLSYLLGSCVGCSGFHGGHAVNGVFPIDSVRHSDGRVIEDNGYTRPLTGRDGTLPDRNDAVAPFIGENGIMPHVVEQPGSPNTIGNRLFLFMEDENDDIESLSRDFKKEYPEDKYGIVGYDKEVKLLVIQIPENERDEIRGSINNKLPNHKFIVFDEEVYELNGSINTSAINPGWHLKAIRLREAWQITKGNENIKVAVVDDGIDPSHPMLANRIVDAYNVFTQNNNLSIGDGHGTHVAGLAVGGVENYEKGAAGVAPNCKLIPIQVFDNRMCPLSALVAGVMYAIHHDADVVNLSICPSFKGLNMLPPQTQDQIAKQQFKNVEKLWARVCLLAARKNCILVFAAGNDDILSSVPPENRNISSIVVTAVDKNLYPTDFTNYGPCSDISAPGKDIYSSYPNNSFRSFDGTSMSAPLITGTIALMKSLKKDLSVEQARNVLYKSGADVFGYIPPMVQVDNALKCVMRNDFGDPAKRPFKPVPDGQGDDSAARNIIGDVLQNLGLNDPDNPKGAKTENIDYDAIRRQIKDHEKKIKELKELLPD